MDLGQVFHYHVPNNNQQKQLSKTVHESRAEELMLEGLEDVFEDVIVVKDGWIPDTESNINIDSILMMMYLPFILRKIFNTISQPTCYSNATKQPATANELATGTSTT